MAFADWLTFSTGSVAPIPPYPAFGLHNDGTTINGNSLTFSEGNGSDAGGTIIADTLPKGFTSGKIQAFVKFFDRGFNSPSYTGIMAMMSQNNLTEGFGGAAYAVGIDMATGFARRFVLARFTDGLGLNPGLALGPFYTRLVETSGPTDWALDTPIALELEWHVRLTTLNGIHLIGRHGPDFGNLTEFANVIERGPDAQLTTVGEGTFFNKGTNTYIAMVDAIQTSNMPEV